MTWDQDLAKQLGSNHSDTQAVIRSGKSGAKRRTRRRRRQLDKQIDRADAFLKLEMAGITDNWYEED